MRKKEIKKLYEGNSYSAEILRWVDGDTVILSIDLGFNISVKEKARLARVDAPEVRKYAHVTESEKRRGLALKQRLNEMLPVGTLVVVSAVKKGKYGRYLVEVWYQDKDGSRNNLNDWLLNKNLVEEVAY